MPKKHRGAVLFLLIGAFVNFAGIGIVNPVLPYVMADYTTPENRALLIGLLTTIYSLAQFLAVPVLGALSDRYGRRPVLLISFLGTAVGYLIFGLGGALWLLFLGRIIDGITGGNIAAIQAYSADISDAKERTHLFGLIGAVGGLGFVIGPALGVLILNITQEPLAVIYAAAVATLILPIVGFFTLKESLPAEQRAAEIGLARMNPFSQLRQSFGIAQIRQLLLVTFIWGAIYALLQGNLSYFTQDHLAWTVDETSLLFFVGGLFTVLGQGFLIKRLLPILGEAGMALTGFVLFALSYALIVWVSVGAGANWMYLALAVGGIGVGLINPSLSGLLSLAVEPNEQGRVQGASQSLQALSRVIGPLWAGWIYQQIGAGAPYFSGIILLGFAIGVMLLARKGIVKNTQAATINY